MVPMIFFILFLILFLGHFIEKTFLQSARTANKLGINLKKVRQDVTHIRCPYCDNILNQQQQYCSSCGQKINTQQIEKNTIAIADLFFWVRGKREEKRNRVLLGLFGERINQYGRNSFEFWTTLVDHKMQPFNEAIQVSFIMTNLESLLPSQLESLSNSYWLFLDDIEFFIYQMQNELKAEIFFADSGIQIASTDYEDRQYSNAISSLGFSYSYEGSLIWVKRSPFDNFPVYIHLWIKTKSNKILYRRSVPTLWNEK